MLPTTQLPCWLQQPNNELYAFCCAKKKLVYIFLLYEICLHFVPCALILFVLVQKMQAVLTCRELLTAVKMEHIRLLLPYCITDAPRNSFCGGVAECGCNNSEQFYRNIRLVGHCCFKILQFAGMAENCTHCPMATLALLMASQRDSSFLC